MQAEAGIQGTVAALIPGNLVFFLEFVSLVTLTHSWELPGF